MEAPTHLQGYLFRKSTIFHRALTDVLQYRYLSASPAMSDQDHLTVDSARGRDDELFTTPSTDPTPDRHPSILRPGGHASPLKHPAALRPGGARHTRTPSPSNGGPTSPPSKSPRASPSPVAYKAYSPTRPKSPSEELSAEIEGYFTALQIQPLHISKTPEPSAVATPPLPPKQQHEIERCASPPVPPKEKIPVKEDLPVVSPVSPISPGSPVLELEACAKRLESFADHADEEEEAPPPPYEPSQTFTAPPEKSLQLPSSNKGSPVGATAASAAHIGGATAGVPVGEAIADSSAALAAIIAEAPPQQEAAEQQHPQEEEEDIYSAGPPPLPPRPWASESPTPAGTDAEPAVPGAFPPPPARPVPAYKVSGAAATSAAGVGGAIAGVGQSASLKQARKALEKGLGHLIDKAKEHHHAREQQSHERKTSGKKASAEAGGKKGVESSGSVAQVSGPQVPSPLGLGVEADLYY